MEAAKERARGMRGLTEKLSGEEGDVALRDERSDSSVTRGDGCALEMLR